LLGDSAVVHAPPGGIVAGWQELELIAGPVEKPDGWQISPGSQAATAGASGRHGPPWAPMIPQRAAAAGATAQPAPASQI
jgi:hypothetical protein